MHPPTSSLLISPFKICLHCGKRPVGRQPSDKNSAGPKRHSWDFKVIVATWRSQTVLEFSLLEPSTANQRDCRALTILNRAKAQCLGRRSCNP
eukprot:1492637-Pyramimonas_sp.AAC.1